MKNVLRIVDSDEPLVEDGDAVREPLGFVEVVRRDEDRAAGGAPLVEEHPHAARHLGIEARGRLVEQQNRRVVQ